MRNALRILLLSANAALFVVSAVSANEPSDEALEKRQLVADCLQLTPPQAAGFWPLYERLQREWRALQREREEHLRNFGRDFAQMNDALALEYTKEHLRHEEVRLNLLRVYLPRFEKVLPARKLARYYQLEDKLHAFVSAETATEIPLVQ